MTNACPGTAVARSPAWNRSRLGREAGHAQGDRTFERPGQRSVERVAAVLGVTLEYLRKGSKGGVVDHDSQLTVDEILTGVHHLLNGCPACIANRAPFSERGAKAVTTRWMHFERVVAMM
jgi:hypothetical protein